MFDTIKLEVAKLAAELIHYDSPQLVSEKRFCSYPVDGNYLREQPKRPRYPDFYREFVPSRAVRALRFGMAAR